MKKHRNRKWVWTGLALALIVTGCSRGGPPAVAGPEDPVPTETVLSTEPAGTLKPEKASPQKKTADTGIPQAAAKMPQPVHDPTEAPQWQETEAPAMEPAETAPQEAAPPVQTPSPEQLHTTAPTAPAETEPPAIEPPAAEPTVQATEPPAAAPAETEPAATAPAAPPTVLPAQPVTAIDTAALGAYGREYASASYGYDGNPNTGESSNAGYFPPSELEVNSMEEAQAIVQELVDSQYTHDTATGQPITGVNSEGEDVQRKINVYVEPTDDPNVYRFYCYYGGE